MVFTRVTSHMFCHERSGLHRLIGDIGKPMSSEVHWLIESYQAQARQFWLKLERPMTGSARLSRFGARKTFFRAAMNLLGKLGVETRFAHENFRPEFKLRRSAHDRAYNTHLQQLKSSRNHGSWTKKAPAPPVGTKPLAFGQTLRCLCAKGLPRPSQAQRLHAFDCLHPQQVRRPRR